MNHRPRLESRGPSRRRADTPDFQITVFDLNGCFVCNLMNHSHIGRARLLSSRGGPHHLRPATFTRPDPGAPRVGCCCSEGFQTCRADGSSRGLGTGSNPADRNVDGAAAPPTVVLGIRPDIPGSGASGGRGADGLRLGPAHVGPISQSFFLCVLCVLCGSIS